MSQINESGLVAGIYSNEVSELQKKARMILLQNEASAKYIQLFDAEIARIQSNAANIFDKIAENFDDLRLVQTYASLYKIFASQYADGDESKKLVDAIDNLKFSFNERKQELDRLTKQFDSYIDDPQLKKLLVQQESLESKKESSKKILDQLTKEETSLTEKINERDQRHQEVMSKKKEELEECEKNLAEAKNILEGTIEDDLAAEIVELERKQKDLNHKLRIDDDDNSSLSGYSIECNESMFPVIEKVEGIFKNPNDFPELLGIFPSPPKKQRLEPKASTSSGSHSVGTSSGSQARKLTSTPKKSNFHIRTLKPKKSSPKVLLAKKSLEVAQIPMKSPTATPVAKKSLQSSSVAKKSPEATPAPMKSPEASPAAKKSLETSPAAKKSLEAEPVAKKPLENVPVAKKMSMENVIQAKKSTSPVAAPQLSPRHLRSGIKRKSQENQQPQPEKVPRIESGNSQQKSREKSRKKSQNISDDVIESSEPNLAMIPQDLVRDSNKPKGNEPVKKTVDVQNKAESVKEISAKDTADPPSEDPRDPVTVGQKQQQNTEDISIPETPTTEDKAKEIEDDGKIQELEAGNQSMEVENKEPEADDQVKENEQQDDNDAEYGVMNIDNFEDFMNFNDCPEEFALTRTNASTDLLKGMNLSGFSIDYEDESAGGTDSRNNSFNMFFGGAKNGSGGEGDFFGASSVNSDGNNALF